MRYLVFTLLLLTAPTWAQTGWKWDTSNIIRLGPGYEFKWSSPILKEAPTDQGAEAWQKALEEEMESWAQEFCQDAEKAFEEAKDSQYKPNAWSSEGEFQVVWTDPQVMIVRWSGYDYRGGAHGMPFQEVRVLAQEKPGELLESSYLFEQDPEALKTISELARAQLLESFEEEELDEWALKGSAPEWDNFRLLYPVDEEGEKSFELIFPPYQVAPYAAGSPTVQLDFKTLRALAKKMGGE